MWGRSRCPDRVQVPALIFVTRPRHTWARQNPAPHPIRPPGRLPLPRTTSTTTGSSASTAAVVLLAGEAAAIGSDGHDRSELWRLDASELGGNTSATAEGGATFVDIAQDTVLVISQYR